MNRTVLAVCLGAMLVLAGCVGGGTDVETTDADAGDGGGDGGGPGAGDGSGSGSSADGEFEYFDFSRPGRFEYDIAMDGETGRMVWDVQDVGSGTVTASVDYSLGDDSFSSTVTGSREEIQSQLVTTPAGAFAMLGLFSPYYGYYEGRDLRVGNEWSYSANGETVSYSVSGRDTIGGVDCYRSEIRSNDQVVHEACFAPDLGLAPFTAFYEEDGTESMRMELTSYERR